MSAHVYTHGSGMVKYFQVRRGKWRIEWINPAGKVWNVSCEKSRKEAASRADSIARSQARHLAEFPPSSSDFDFFNDSRRPMRTPWFYRQQATIWARHHRRRGLLWEDGGALRLAKSYLKSYRETLAIWIRRYGLAS